MYFSFATIYDIEFDLAFKYVHRDEWDAKEMQAARGRAGGALPGGRRRRQLLPDPFDIRPSTVEEDFDPYEIKPPNLDLIFDAQGFDEETKREIYTMMAALLPAERVRAVAARSCSSAAAARGRAPSSTG